MAKEIKKKYPQTKAIAGVATGAIGIGMLVAEALDLPFIYVRPQPKKHGRKNQIEGHFNPNDPTIVIEDLISTGKSSLEAVKALRKEKVNVLGMVALFSYEFDTANENMTEANIQLSTLSNYNTLIKTAVQEGYIESHQLEILKKWQKAPQNWKEN